MYRHIPVASFVAWFVVSSGQIAVAIRSFRFNKRLSFSLASQVLFSCFGISLILLGDMAAYEAAYYLAGMWNIVIAGTMFFTWFEELRGLARGPFRSIAIPLITLFLCGIMAARLGTPAIQSASPRLSWHTAHAVGHIAWLWLALYFALTPIYIAVAMAFPPRMLVANLSAMGIYILLYSGLADKFLSAHSSDLNSIKIAFDFLYLFPLAIWFTAIPREKTIPNTEIGLKHA